MAASVNENNPKIAEIFTETQEYFLQEDNTKEKIRSIVKLIDNDVREITRLMQIIHTTKDCSHTNSAITKSRDRLANIKDHLQTLNGLIPYGQYYRYHDSWKYTMQKLCFLSCLIVYLEKPTHLIEIHTVASILGVNELDNLMLDTEDYLMGVLFLVTELIRLAVNSVTLGDYDTPMQISTFVSAVDAGFRLLNLKNDSLRKRYDVLKYDVKKIEEIVYDLKIRGFVSQQK